jgi:hypothetical protein
MRQTGVITAVIEPRDTPVCGHLSEMAGAGYVQVDGAPFAQPILVGDASQNVKPRRQGGREMEDSLPTHAGEGDYRGTGDRSRPGVDTLLVMREF